MSKIKTAGELRGFLADVLVDIRNGSVDVAEASAIAKVAAQINQSLAVEVNTALQLQKMGKDHPVAGSMMIASGNKIDAGTWCDQCDVLVSAEVAAGCKSRHCSLRPTA